LLASLDLSVVEPFESVASTLEKKREFMNVKLFGSMSICIICIVSCASLSTERIFDTETSTFVSNNPPLKVMVKYPQAAYDEKKVRSGQGYNIELHSFKTAEGPIFIFFVYFTGRGRMVMDYYHFSVETLIRETPFKVIDSVSINDKKWFRVYMFKEDKFLSTGYITQRSQYLVGITKVSIISGELKGIFALQDLSDPSPALLDLLEDEFASANTFYEIAE
jgi:hypothetical protein